MASVAAKKIYELLAVKDRERLSKPAHDSDDEDEVSHPRRPAIRRTWEDSSESDSDSDSDEEEKRRPPRNLGRMYMYRISEVFEPADPDFVMNNKIGTFMASMGLGHHEVCPQPDGSIVMFSTLYPYSFNSTEREEMPEDTSAYPMTVF